MTLRSTLLVALIFASGCAQGPRSPKTVAVADPLDVGPSRKVSARGAADVQFALGRSFEEAGSLAEAEAAYRRAIHEAPKRPEAHARLAVLLAQRGEFAEASQQFAEAVRRDPGNAEILCDQGYSLAIQRKWPDAEAAYRRALTIQPNHARTHENLALVLARKGETALALEEFARAGLDPADSHANLGLVLAMEGRYAEARASYAQALAARPDSPAAREGLKALARVDQAGANPGAAKVAVKPGPDSNVRRASTTNPETNARP